MSASGSSHPAGPAPSHPHISSLNIHQILRAHESTNQQSEPSITMSNPRFGLFRRTLVQSPCIKFLFTARIRHKHCNEVVLVGENFVHLSAIKQGKGHEGETVLLATKTDFPGKIRSAGVIGDAFVPHQGLPDELSSSEAEEQQFPPNMLVLLFDNGEIMFLVASTNYENGHLDFYHSSAPLPERRTLFQQPGAHMAIDNRCNVIALAAYDGFIELLKLKTWADIAEEFSRNKQDWGPLKYLRSIFQESEPRTIMKMAFLYPEDDLPTASLLAVIVRVNNRTRVRCWQGNLFQGPERLSPFIDNPLDIGPLIPDLMVPYQHSPSFLLTCSTTLWFIKLMGPQVQSYSQSSYPQPGNEIDHPEIYAHPPRFTAFCHCFRGQMMASTGKEEFYILREDGLLLLISDHRLTPSNRPLSASSHTNAAKIDCHGFTALTTFLTTGTLADPDRIIVAGDMSDGQSISIGAWSADQFRNSPDIDRRVQMRSKFIQQYPNWSPTHDMTVTTTKHSSQSALYMTSNRQPYGVITEMRTGREAQVISPVLIPGLEEYGGAISLCVTDNGSPSALNEKFYFISFVTHTVVVQNRQDSWERADDLSRNTLAVAHGNDYILHASQENLSLWTPEGICQDTHLAQLDFANSSQIVAASAMPLSSAMIVAHRNFDTDYATLALYDGVVDATEPSPSILVVGREQATRGYSPTCIAVFSLPQLYSQHYALVGGADGSLHLYCVEGENSGRPGGISDPIVQYNPAKVDSTPQAAVVESIGVLADDAFPGPGKPHNLVVVCGLRGGALALVSLTVSSSRASPPSFIFGRSRTMSLGTHPVKIHTDIREIHHTAFATCASSTFCLSLLCGSLEVHNVCYNTQKRLGFKQPLHPVMQIVPTNTKRSVGPLRAATFCKEGLYLSELGDETNKPILHRIPLSFIKKTTGIKTEEKLEKDREAQHSLREGGTPYKLLYSTHLDAMIVASTRMELYSPSDKHASQLSNQRVWRSLLHFIPMQSPTREMEMSEMAFYTNPQDSSALEFGAFERITSVCEWRMRISEQPQVLVATRVKKSDGVYGRLYFLKVTVDDAKGFITGTVALIKDFKKPITTMTVYDASKLVVCDADELCIYGFEEDASSRPKWRLLAQTRIHDYPRMVTAKPPYVYISTASMSFIAYTCVGNTTTDGTTAYSLVKHFSDEVYRPTPSHLVLDVPNPSPLTAASSAPSSAPSTSRLVLLPTDANTLAILVQPSRASNAGQNIAVRTLLHTHLPDPITRLSIAPLRPPWLKHLANLPGLLGPDILGTSPAGSITHIRILDPLGTHLLKYLENLTVYTEAGVFARRTTSPYASMSGQKEPWESPTIDPVPHVQNWDLHNYYSSEEGLRAVPGAGSGVGYALRRQTDHLSRFAVNGDLLQVFARPDGARKLADQLMQETWEPEVEDASADALETAERNGNERSKRMERFVKLVALLLQQEEQQETHEDGWNPATTSAVDVDFGETEPDDVPPEVAAAVRRCVGWLRDIWQFI